MSAQRLVWRLRLIYAGVDARRATYHADWYCSLPAWKRWLVMVRGL